MLAPGAVEDLDRHRSYYSGIDPSLAERFVDAFFLVADRLAVFPLSSPKIERAPRFRRALLREFPVSVIYQVLDGSVRILALPHHRQDADAWRLD